MRPSRVAGKVRRDEDIIAPSVGGAVKWDEGADTVVLPPAGPARAGATCPHGEGDESAGAAPTTSGVVETVEASGVVERGDTGGASTGRATTTGSGGVVTGGAAGAGPVHGGARSGGARSDVDGSPDAGYAVRSPESVAAGSPGKNPAEAVVAEVRKASAANPIAGANTATRNVLESVSVEPKQWSSMSRSRKRAAWVGLGVAVAGVLLATALVAGWQAQQARDELLAAQAATSDVEESLRAFDVPAARSATVTVQEHTGAAEKWATAFPLTMSRFLPGVGDDVRAAQQAATSVDDVATEVMPRLVDAAANMDPEQMAPREGRVDLAPMVESREPLTQALSAVEGVQADLAGIETAGLDESLAARVDDLSESVAELRSTTQDAVDVATVVPGLLGQEGPRDILVLFQNNAELRTRGGIPGAGALLRTEGGQVTMVEQFTAGSLGPFEESVLPLGEMEAVHGNRLGRFMQDVNLTPHYPTTGELAAAMWHRARPESPQVSAVIATDPVVLSYLLGSTGPIMVDGRELGEGNAASVLMNETYREVADPRVMDAFFAQAASSSFDAVLSRGSGDVTMQALRKAISERRLLVWSAVPAEQEVLQHSVVGGAFDAESVGSSRIGVFLNGATASKLGYYVHQTLRTSPWCAGDEFAVLGTKINLTLRSDAPADVTDYPTYLAGNGDQGVPPGTEKLLVMLYSPPGTSFEGVRVNGQQTNVSVVSEHGMHVSVVAVELPPGERVELSAFVSGVDFAAHEVSVTPLAHASVVEEALGCQE